MSAEGAHDAMLATAPRTPSRRAQRIRIDTLALVPATVAVDRNVPRALATALNRYAPGGTIPNDR